MCGEGDQDSQTQHLAPNLCQNATMQRINLRDVPDDVYETLVQAAKGQRQSLNAFVVSELVELADAIRRGAYIESFPAPSGTGVTIEDAVAAVRAVREAS